VLRAVVLTQHRRVMDRRTEGRTDGRTDGIAIANTALAMRALRRAVKSTPLHAQNRVFDVGLTLPKLCWRLGCRRQEESTSGQSNLTTGHIAASHVRFTGIRQIAPVCTRYLICTSFGPSIPSPNPKRHIDRFSCFCTADGRVSLYFTTAAHSPLKLPLPWGI